MSDGRDKPGTGDFGKRLDALKRSRDERSGEGAGDAPDVPDTPMQGVGYGLRIGTELVAALLVGLAIGYGLDHWLGTTPWLMILFLFLGMAAGVSNVYRLASGMDMGIGWRRPGDRSGNGASSANGDGPPVRSKGEE